MLSLRPNCECCDHDLPPDSAVGPICTYALTFCADGVDGPLGGVCPNCDGAFVPRPLRPAVTLLKALPWTPRVVENPLGCGRAA